MSCTVFLSLRVHEDDGGAVRLRDALEAAGVSVYLCDPLAGDELAAEIAVALDACELFVVLGTRSYGMPSDCKFSTREELQFAKDHRKPIFLIKRCDEFADPLTRLYLPAGMCYRLWPPLTDIPEDLVDEIVVKLAAGPQEPPRAAQDLDPLVAQRR
jgi:hypothetical protein